jgi:hypothetical protein
MKNSLLRSRAADGVANSFTLMHTVAGPPSATFRLRAVAENTVIRTMELDATPAGTAVHPKKDCGSKDSESRRQEMIPTSMRTGLAAPRQKVRAGFMLSPESGVSRLEANISSSSDARGGDSSVPDISQRSARCGLRIVKLPSSQTSTVRMICIGCFPVE